MRGVVASALRRPSSRNFSEDSNKSRVKNRYEKYQSRKKEVEEILVSFRKLSPERLEKVREICREADVSLKRALLKIEPIDFD